MSDTFITVMVVILVVGLMLVAPFVITTNQNEKVTQTTVDTLVANFVNTAAKEGKISSENYDSFIQELYATGNSYNVELEVQHFDENPGKKGRNQKVLGENIYYSVYKNEIETEIKDNGVYKLNKGDYVLAKVENTNVTIGTQIKNFLFSVMGKDTIVIESNASALVSTTAK